MPPPPEAGGPGRGSSGWGSRALLRPRPAAPSLQPPHRRGRHPAGWQPPARPARHTWRRAPRSGGGCRGHSRRPRRMAPRPRRAQAHGGSSCMGWRLRRELPRQPRSQRCPSTARAWQASRTTGAAAASWKPPCLAAPRWRALAGRRPLLWRRRRRRRWRRRRRRRRRQRRRRRGSGAGAGRRSFWGARRHRLAWFAARRWPGLHRSCKIRLPPQQLAASRRRRAVAQTAPRPPLTQAAAHAAQMVPRRWRRRRRRRWRRRRRRAAVVAAARAVAPAAGAGAV
jgi:hypothetical protein